MIICRYCNEEKLYDQFEPRRRVCRECRNATLRAGRKRPSQALPPPPEFTMDVLNACWPLGYALYKPGKLVKGYLHD